MIKIQVKLIIVLSLLLSECTTKVESIIKTGMELKKAEEILMNFGAQEAKLQIRPEKSITGEYMNLEIYSLRQKPYIIINHEEENGENIIKTIGLYYIKTDSKKNSQGRTLLNVDNIDLIKL